MASNNSKYSSEARLGLQHAGGAQEALPAKHGRTRTRSVCRWSAPTASRFMRKRLPCCCGSRTRLTRLLLRQSDDAELKSISKMAEEIVSVTVKARTSFHPIGRTPTPYSKPKTSPREDSLRLKPKPAAFLVSP